MPRKTSKLRIGDIEIPAPTAWPAATRQWFESVTPGRGNADLYIFEPKEGPAFCILEDAIAAFTLLDRAGLTVSTGGGYPIVTFDAATVEERGNDLANFGYRVHILTPVYDDGKRADVIDISAAAARRSKAKV